jgi:predicted nucleic acid-binding protein
MIAYFDTSALVKFYIDEKDSDLVKKIIDTSEIVFTSKIAYIEILSVFFRLKREGAIAEKDHRKILKSFITDWGSYALIEVTDRVMIISGQLVELYPLRSLDAIHLGSALFVQKEVEEDMAFVCFDARLGRAAAEENFKVIPEMLNGVG